MKMTVMIPFMNNLRFGMPMMGCLKYNTSEETEWMIIDNGSTDKVENYIRHYIKPKRLFFHRNEVSPGLLKNSQFAYENCETELLCFLHNDCYVYEKDWDKRIISYFEKMPDLGLAGFFGAQGCMSDGGRLQDTPAGEMAGLSNMLEAEIHGMRLGNDELWKACSIFDSFCLIMRMDMLKKGNGFDMRYKWHHYYDRDISLESLRRGYKNIVVNVPNHHIGGVTHELDIYQEWLTKQIGKRTEDGVVHNENKEKFMKKWHDVLPLYVNDDFSFREGPLPVKPSIEYKGNKIVGFKC